MAWNVGNDEVHWSLCLLVPVKVTDLIKKIIVVKAKNFKRYEEFIIIFANSSRL